ncbi:helicase associated domain-containing protein (plasmid) [Arthrobacter agilis]|uniref:helicase associated domain-containing protein n=1 Tax=Arthrobacter agilis TaxID=37921 RepID=UPI00236598CB|nr:helicase associated domain-containing protein [Arthrobacter agilis]WDF35272.1 helicase associated domain-containing protein [Arthrobacter agilis]
MTKTLEETWWGHYEDLAVYMGERGGQRPRQNDSPRAAALYSWSFAQRRALDAGTLTAERREALDRLGEWSAGRNENPEELWERRLGELQQFVAGRGRFPAYNVGLRGTGEHVLGVWVSTQRTRFRKGRMRTDRRERLDRMLPGWV